MPTREESRVRAAAERLQAHPVGDTGEYIVYNPSSGSRYTVRPFPHSTPQSPAYYCECPWARHGGAARGGPCKHVQRVLDRTNHVELTCTGCGRKVERRTQLRTAAGSGGLIRHCASCRFEDRMRNSKLEGTQ
jgi:hypothetical protein